jgi:5-methylcytosine-specific restriction endonuclease McrA
VILYACSCGSTHPKGQRCPVKQRERDRLRGPTIYHTRRWKEARAKVLARDGHCCRECGTSQELAVHHVEPVSEGGAFWDLDNLVTLCITHHNQADAARRAGDKREYDSIVGSELPTIA